MLDNVVESPLTPEKNETLVARLREGDQSVRDQLILGNIPLVRYKVGTWLTEYPNLKFIEDDMLLEGTLALTRAIKRLGQLSQPEDPDESNVTGYISTAIHRAIGRLVGHEYKHRTSGSVSELLSEEDPTEFIDFLDELQGACETEEHLILLQLRADGHTDEYVANVLDCSRAMVHVLKTEILANLEARRD